MQATKIAWHKLGSADNPRCYSVTVTPPKRSLTHAAMNNLKLMAKAMIQV
jgi:hypothetical protein